MTAQIQITKTILQAAGASLRAMRALNDYEPLRAQAEIYAARRLLKTALGELPMPPEERKAAMGGKD